MKTCTHCHHGKPPESFRLRTTTSSRRRSWCRDCEDAQMRKAAKSRHWRDIEAARAAGRRRSKKHRAAYREKELRAREDRRQRQRLSDPAYHLKARQYSATRRGRKATTDVAAVDFERIARRDRMRCHLCRKGVSRRNLTFDHVIPLAAGGSHTEANIAVAHARCNLRKGSKVLSLF